MYEDPLAPPSNPATHEWLVSTDGEVKTPLWLYLTSQHGNWRDVACHHTNQYWGCLKLQGFGLKIQDTKDINIKRHECGYSYWAIQRKRKKEREKKKREKKKKKGSLEWALLLKWWPCILYLLLSWSLQSVPCNFELPYNFLIIRYFQGKNKHQQAAIIILWIQVQHAPPPWSLLAHITSRPHDLY